MGVLVFTLAVTAFVLYSSHALADDKPNHDRDDKEHHSNGIFNPDKELSQSSCGKNLGKPVINVTQRVQNDADSGEAGNYWAFDYYMRHITVWETATAEAGNTYCAIVTYEGNFYTVPGQVGPGNNPTGAVINSSTNEPVNGRFSGGRRAIIVGNLLNSPLWTKQGNVGTTNYQCNIQGTCSGLISWPGQYFGSGYSYSDSWWGWKYNAGVHGTWINALSGNSGNIL